MRFRLFYEGMKIEPVLGKGAKLPNQMSNEDIKKLVMNASNKFNLKLKDIEIKEKSKTGKYLGHCWKERKCILLYRKDLSLETIAHELAHLKYEPHYKKHLELTIKILKYLEHFYI
jgi:hypothetical protein